ncbi:MAG TPA: histidine phosphatase family protein [Thermoanaerobaculia bacterium]|nr:histidine phosphatase family protein [Thermoanaerobaculia bacterium]
MATHRENEKSSRSRRRTRAARRASDETTSPHDEDRDEPRDRFVVLLRHGLAEERGPDKADEERSLTAEGHDRMKQIARGLETVFPRAEAICSSPLVRAMQTALWVSKGYRSRIEVQTSGALSPGSDPSELRSLIDSMPVRRIILVGHEPNLTQGLMALLGMRDLHLELKKGGCYGVRMYADGSASLEWLLSPRVLRRMA